MSAAVCVCVRGQDTRIAGAPVEVRGLPPRAAPADYQAQAQAGTLTVAAEFKGHSVPTLQGPLFTEGFVAVETGLFGPPGARIKLSIGDFTLRINGRKTPLLSQPYGLVVMSLRDPEWEPPTPAASKPKTSFGDSGQVEADAPPPGSVKIPVEVQRAMAQRVQKAALPEGDRSLPQAGLIFFPYRGKSPGIRSVELTYAGPDGTATLTLQP